MTEDVFARVQSKRHDSSPVVGDGLPPLAVYHAVYLQLLVRLARGRDRPRLEPSELPRACAQSDLRDRASSFDENRRIGDAAGPTARLPARLLPLLSCGEA